MFDFMIKKFKKFKNQSKDEEQIGKCEHCDCEITNNNYSPHPHLCDKCFYKYRIYAGSCENAFWKFDEATKELRIYGSGCLTAFKNDIDEIRFSVYDPHNLGIGYDFPIFNETGITKSAECIVICNGIEKIDPDGTQFLAFRSVRSILISPSVMYVSDKFEFDSQEDRMKIKVFGVKGSYAEIYSKEHNMIFEPIEMSEIPYGKGDI